MSTVDVNTEIIIDRPVGRVSEYVADPENAPEWYVNIRSAEWRSPKPLSEGSLIAFIAHFLGRKLEYTYQVMEYQVGKKMVMKTADGPFPMQTTYEWEELSDHQTKMKLRNAGSPSGFSKLFAPFMAGAMKRANNNDLKLLKQLLESSK